MHRIYFVLQRNQNTMLSVSYKNNSITTELLTRRRNTLQSDSMQRFLLTSLITAPRMCSTPSLSYRQFNRRDSTPLL